MRRFLVLAATVAAVSGGAPATASAETCPTCDVRQAADAAVGLVVHALWPTLSRVGPLLDSIYP